MIAAPSRRRAGFSLVEMTVLLVTSSILAAAMYAYFGRSITHGYVPAAALQETLDLATAVESLTSDYRSIVGRDSAPAWTPQTPYQVGDRVRVPGRDFGHLFQCARGGVSGASPPAWPNAPGTRFGDGTVLWEVLPGELDAVVRKIPLLADGSGSGAVDGVVRDYEYGRYGVVFLGFIDFADGEERPAGPAGPRNLLKVVLVNAPGERMTTLLTTSY
jgi:hypothetical protein